MENNPVIWFELYVQDMPRARRFYESVFGWTLTKIETSDIEMWGFPMDQSKVGAGGALVRMEGAPSGPGGTLVYFMCEDCSVHARRFAEFGGKTCRDKFSIGQYGYIALVADSEGNVVGLHSMQ